VVHPVEFDVFGGQMDRPVEHREHFCFLIKLRRMMMPPNLYLL